MIVAEKECRRGCRRIKECITVEKSRRIGTGRSGNIKRVKAATRTPKSNTGNAKMTRATESASCLSKERTILYRQQIERAANLIRNRKSMPDITG